MNDTVEGRSLSVIATHLPYIDRRSLSEAWFSALHLASDGPVTSAPPERRGLDEGSAAHGNLGSPARFVDRDTAVRSIANAFGGTRSARPGAELSTESAAVPKAGRVRALANRARSYAPFRTSLTFGVDGERVALLLRREGTTLHVVALCRPAVADIVRRALASADSHLRAAGERVDARVETLPSGVVA